MKKEAIVKKLEELKIRGTWIPQEGDGDNPEVEVYFGWQTETDTGGITHEEWVVTVGGELGLSTDDANEAAEYILGMLD